MHKIYVVFILLFFSGLVTGQMPGINCEDSDIFCFEEDFEEPNGQNVIYTLPDPDLDNPTLECPPRLCGMGGNPNNILYFSFVPNASTVTIQINALFCSQGFTSTDVGYQWGVYETDCEVLCDGDDPESLICHAFDPMGNPNTGMTEGTANNFIPGQTYILFVDGFGGSVCQFTVDFLEGLSSINNPFTVDEPSHFTTSSGEFVNFNDTLDFCENGFFTTTVHGSTNASSYLWSMMNDNGSTEIFLPSDADTLFQLFNEPDSLYKIYAMALTDCDDSEQYCFYVDVAAEPTDSLGTFEYCMNDLVNGVRPPGWECDSITSPGQYFCTVTDTLLGCTVLQWVRVIGNNATIVEIDSLHCGLEPVFYNDSTITALSDTLKYIFPNGTVNGCDSIVWFRLNRIGFEGSISDLVCLNNGEYGLSVNIESLSPQNPSSIIIEWYKDNSLYAVGNPNDFDLVITEKGLYSASVNIVSAEGACSFDLGEIIIDKLISTDFNLSTDSICISDLITVNLGEFHDMATYTWDNVDIVNEIAPGVFELAWNNAGIYNINMNVDYDNCSNWGNPVSVYVENLLDSPVIYCTSASNDSIYITWDMVDCSGEYEVWLDGNLIDNTTSTEYTFNGLEEGSTYDIMVNALSDCLCPGTSFTTSCSTNDCPDNISLSIQELPASYCLDVFTNDIALNGMVSGSSGGQSSWSGDLVDENGNISAAGIQSGVYDIYFSYEIDNCSYEVMEQLTIYPSVIYDVEHYDLSCYYSNDGSIIITPVEGSAPFSLFINGTQVSGLDTMGLEGGSYDILVSDLQNCSSVDNVEILIPEAPKIFIDGTTLIERGQLYDYELSIDNISYDSVVWHVPLLDTILCSGICDEISYAPEFDQQLCIELFYDDVCKIDTCIDLRVNRDVHVFVPNAFSPGIKDGINDYFMVKTNAYEEVHVLNFSVFDRWGGMIFNKTDVYISGNTDDSFGWDGTLNGQEMMAGVYVYFIEYEDNEGNLVQVYGDLTLIR